MGGPKALLEFEGRLLVERAAEVLRDGGCDPVVVVLGAGADEVRHRAHLPHARIIDNPNWAEGQAGSLRIGLVDVGDEEAGGADAVVIALVDQPAIRAAVVRRLIEGKGPLPSMILALTRTPPRRR